MDTKWRYRQQHYCHRWWSSESECRRKRFRHGYQCRRGNRRHDTRYPG
nr:hypothetical protein [Escherichia coli]